MDYRKTAQEIYDHIGKKENIISAAHCATRLRLVISDNSKADKEYVENIEGVKGVFFAQGQMQIILGTGVVNKVYDEFIRIAGVSESSKEELKKVAASRANPVQRLIKTLGDIFVPIIPAFLLRHSLDSREIRNRILTLTFQESIRLMHTDIQRLFLVRDRHSRQGLSVRLRRKLHLVM